VGVGAREYDEKAVAARDDDVVVAKTATEEAH